MKAALPFRRFLSGLTRAMVSMLMIHLSASAFAAAEEKTAPAVDLKGFLVSTKGTYGWEPVKAGGDGLSYDFFPDGGPSGPDGEAAWERSGA
jgi:hypothetical protein